ncbi:MAG TPA: RtcB family protein [Syntrophales bacterium]|nr:RtcB family protein [Syntrophales bacterium]HOX93534.1 RtcB family protein [Syntrophales bacterium]HPI55997.1 RtcB family protein [Syntrophales bacterium]HPN24113.1 RtcB family protein [Syntrophales bacterium]HQM28392.1 RtcB family protein [Syntrophales bacterium]
MSEIRMKRIDDYRWEITPFGGMRVPGIIYSSEKLMKGLEKDESAKQVANVAHLPGIVRYSLAMPDIHWGYGFPIGGVAAFDLQKGVISPGGVGYDINCGCRLVATKLKYGDVRDRMEKIVTALFRDIPTGVGSTGALKLPPKEEKRVMVEGAEWAVKNGYGTEEDLEATEDGGRIEGADPGRVSARAMERGREQVGTLGSGNHFLEIEIVSDIYDDKVAAAFGLEKDQVAVMIHCGSRGFGHQICDDYLARMMKQVGKLGIELPDRQLACTYVQSEEGQDYLAAMACAANYAWANRQVLMHRTGETLQKALQISPRDLGMRLVYDVCHNIAKIEEFDIDGAKKRLCVHRKGATRAFPPNHPALSDKYIRVGQPVLIPGDMGTGSYVLAGTEKAMEETFGSTCHGAGRVMSRAQAIKAGKGRAIRKEMAERGVIVIATGKGTLAEEMPEAYKDIDEVVEAVHGAGISRKVARLKAVGCIKG